MGTKIERKVVLRSSLLSSEGENVSQDEDLYEEGFVNPDPGVLKEKNDLSFSEPAPMIFTSSSKWQALTLRARARQLWLLLRMNLHGVVEKEKRAELHVMLLKHGLEPLRCLEMSVGVKSLTQDPTGKRFVVLDCAGRLHLHKEDGWTYGKLKAPLTLTGLVAVQGLLGKVSRFVGWGPEGLALLKSNFQLLWLSGQAAGSTSDQEPTGCLPVPGLGLLVVTEARGALALWKFQMGGRHLVPSRSPLEPPPNLGALGRLALGPRGSHYAPCFAAYGSSVLTINLHTWTLTDIQRNLHRITISDLVYCEDMRVMVTASWDSTVKVWDSNWQIQMAFLGHTGSVTALTVLPGTPLVLSASLDGTLRTWDLQTSAQVGKVELCAWKPYKKSKPVKLLLPPTRPGCPVISVRTNCVQLWHLHKLYLPLAQLSAPVLHLQVAPSLPVPSSPSLPVRLVCLCEDSSVYLVSLSTGQMISALLLEPKDQIISVAYCLPLETLWVLTHTGDLLCTSAACCPMVVLHQKKAPPAPEPRPCCLHLYSHLTDSSSAFKSWKAACNRGGAPPTGSDIAKMKKDMNRYLPVMGHTDGSLSVLEWHTWKTVFHTQAHRQGPVTAIASSWNTIVTSGQDFTVKVWRVFPYSEESLSPLHTFSSCHLAVALCTMERRVTVAFEDPDTATYGLVQLYLGQSLRYDHRPQDDPMDHITSLSCCPLLRLYACSSLDCTVRIWTAENRLLRLLQLDGAPQALTFCSDTGDLVLALGSRLCLVSHEFYLPTSYLLMNLCQQFLSVVEDPPLPLTNQELLTSGQLQRLTVLRGMAKFSITKHSIQHPTATLQKAVTKEDLATLAARNHDLQQLKLGLVDKATQPLTPKQYQEAFENYIHLIYGTCFSDMDAKGLSEMWYPFSLTMDRLEPTGRSHPKVCMEPHSLLRTLSQHLAHIPTYWGMHSRASQLLACSSLSENLHLSLDLQVMTERLYGLKSKVPAPLRTQLPPLPLLPTKWPRDLPSNLGGFFPTTIKPKKSFLVPIRFPGCVPNSVVLQKLWSKFEFSWLEYLARSQAQFLQAQEDEEQKRYRRYYRPFFWHSEDEDSMDSSERAAVAAVALEYSPEKRSDASLSLVENMPSQSSQMLLGPEDSSYSQPSSSSQEGRLLWEGRYKLLPKFLRYFVTQNWFKKLFPIFSLEAYPEMNTVEGLASQLIDVLEGASWRDRAHILHSLLRLVPELSRELCARLQDILLHLLNTEPPPTFQDPSQKLFVVLALQLLLACSLDSQEVVLELMTYFLYSPPYCRPEIRKLLEGLGLDDPHGCLFKEMLSWVQGCDLSSKATLRQFCKQKLRDIRDYLQGPPLYIQMDTFQPTLVRLSEVLSSTWKAPSTFKEMWSQTSLGAAGTPFLRSRTPSGTSRTPSTAFSQGEDDTANLESYRSLMQRLWQNRRSLSELLQPFTPVSSTHMFPSAMSSEAPQELPALEQTAWAQTQYLDLGTIDLLNLFCEELRRRRQFEGLESATSSPFLSPLLSPLQSPRALPSLYLLEEEPNVVLRQSVHHRDGQRLSILRLRAHKTMRIGQALPSLWADNLQAPARMLKLPLPRVNLQPFPPGWPRPARPLPPLLLQPSLQRYFLPSHSYPGKKA